MTIITTITDFADDAAEAGVGLALQDTASRYLFFLAGTRHRCPPGELFYAGVGGHREPGEEWVSCARREAHEEIGADIALLSAPTTYVVPHRGEVHQVMLRDQPCPLALYEMMHPPGSPREGQIYRLVIYQAHLQTPPRDFPADEVRGIILLNTRQIIQGLERKPSLATLIQEGAELRSGDELVPLDTRVYPIGTAKALALIFERTQLHTPGG